MANRTVKDAKSIKGTNPQYLVEKIIRTRIYDCKYWKEECFALTAELLVDKAMELRYIGGVYGGNVKPTPFLCLILKMLQIQPEKDIIVEFIKNEDFKYVRALGAYYMRLTGTSLDCYNYLEPLLNDHRKLRRQNRSGVYELIHMDEFVDELLREERSCDVILPRLQKRHILEENNEIQPRLSILEEENDVDDDDDGELKGDELRNKSNSPDRDRDTKSRRKHREDNERRHHGSSDSEDRLRRRKRRASPEEERRRHKSESNREKRSSPDRQRKYERQRDHRTSDRYRRSPEHSRDKNVDGRDRERPKRDKERGRDRYTRDQERGRDKEFDRNKHHRSSRRSPS